MKETTTRPSDDDDQRDQSVYFTRFAGKKEKRNECGWKRILCDMRHDSHVGLPLMNYGYHSGEMNK